MKYITRTTHKEGMIVPGRTYKHGEERVRME